MRSLTLVSLFVLAGCSQLVVGNGRPSTASRDVAAFRQVRVEDALNAIVTPGTRSVTISTDENLQDLIESRVDGDTLVLRMKDGVFFNTMHTQITVTNDVIAGVSASGASNVQAVATHVRSFAVSASGSSDVNVVDIDATDVTVDASGSSDVALSGTATSAILKASGSSDLVLTSLPLESAEIHLSGSSTFRGAVSKSLTGSASGSSDAFISGTPTSSVQLTGSSTLNNGQ